MRAGILMIGSLLWDERKERDEWRQSRLSLGRAIHVRVPIRYGRRSESRGNTFTMIFARDDALGQGVLVPCRGMLPSVQALLVAAEELWKAEQPGAPTGSISASWGCVGVLVRAEPPPDDWLQAWADHFRRKASPILPVGADGLLHLPWPERAAEGTAADMDLILATATRAEETPPRAEEVADAWINQEQAHERYFFENVRHGIRTPEDGLIWQRIQEAGAPWLRGGAYADAITTLSREHVPGV